MSMRRSLSKISWMYDMMFLHLRLGAREDSIPSPIGDGLLSKPTKRAELEMVLSNTASQHMIMLATC